LQYVFLLLFFVVWQFVSLVVTESQFNNVDQARAWCAFYKVTDTNSCDTARQGYYFITASGGIMGLVALMVLNILSLAFYRSVRQDIDQKHEEALKQATTLDREQHSESGD
jgi:uncharacterized membrane protein